MKFNRGAEVINGQLLSKPGSGTYEYKLTEGEISLYWMLSSNSNFHDYHFEVKGNRLHIENFYDPNSEETLTFEKPD